MVTKGYGWTVEMIDWACPADLEPYEKAYQLERKSIDSYTYSAVGGYGISALVFAIEHCLSGKKAKSEYIKRPMMEEADPDEAMKREIAMAKREAMLAQVKATNQKLMEMDKSSEG